MTDDLELAIAKRLKDKFDADCVVTGFVLAFTTEQIDAENPSFYILTGNDNHQPIISVIGLLEAALLMVRRDFMTQGIDDD